MNPTPEQISAAAPLLQLDDIEFSFGSRKVLDGFGVTIPEGEIHGLLGPNGSGKSTALSLLTGLIPTQSGSFLLRGAPFKPHDRAYLQDMGVVFQSPSIDLQLSCRENLDLAARLQGISRKDAPAKIERALARLLQPELQRCLHVRRIELIVAVVAHRLLDSVGTRCGPACQVLRVEWFGRF